MLHVVLLEPAPRENRVRSTTRWVPFDPIVTPRLSLRGHRRCTLPPSLHVQNVCIFISILPCTQVIY
jgi:hypothetical protein